jgi:NAD(P)-dependent dehydrogenase (short-subunit alcohol dehydrogenase family)
LHIVGTALATTAWGGWYSYRASKAALNMLVKTAAIEVARTHPQALLVALQPGTVNSALSAPFNGAEIGRPALMQRPTCCECWMGCRWKKRAGFMRTAGTSCLGPRADA